MGTLSLSSCLGIGLLEVHVGFLYNILQIYFNGLHLALVSDVPDLLLIKQSAGCVAYGHCSQSTSESASQTFSLCADGIYYWKRQKYSSIQGKCSKGRVAYCCFLSSTYFPFQMSPFREFLLPFQMQLGGTFQGLSSLLASQRTSHVSEANWGLPSWNQILSRGAKTLKLVDIHSFQCLYTDQTINGCVLQTPLSLLTCCGRPGFPIAPGSKNSCIQFSPNSICWSLNKLVVEMTLAVPKSSHIASALSKGAL